MTGLLNDLRLAVRGLLRHRVFTSIAVLTLTLGIGATTAVFTLVDGVLLSPLPFAKADELISVGHQALQDEVGLSDGLYLLYDEQAPSIESIAMYFGPTVTVMGDGGPQRMPAQRVTPGFFDVLQVEAAIGRTFVEEEGAPDGEQVVLLSDGLWKSDFGGDPAILGQLWEVDGSMRRIVGVMPPDFGYPDRAARMWVPLQVDPARARLDIMVPRGVARLAPGATVERAYAEIQGLITRLPELYPESRIASILRDRLTLRARVTPLKEALVGDLTRTLWILFGTVGFVLLIACANVANLLLIRAEGRQREQALRVAMGAGRIQLLRSYLGESVVLAGAGGVLGVGAAALAVQASMVYLPRLIPRAAEIGVDLRVLGFTAAIALGCAVFFGLFPMLKYSTDNLAGQLRGGGSHGSAGSRERHRLRHGLVVGQLALVLVLLIGSALMFRSVQALRAVDLGFEPEGVLTARIWVPAAEVQDLADVIGFYRTLRLRLATQPGVEAVGLARAVPLTSGGANFGGVSVEDPLRVPGDVSMAYSNSVEAGYFESLGIPLLEGRTFREGDGADGTQSVVVTKAFAEFWWPNQSALGRRILRGGAAIEIVGVVGDARYEKLNYGPEGMVYSPVLSGSEEDPSYFRNMDVAIRTAGDPMRFLPVLRREMRALNPRIAVSSPRTMKDLVAGVTARESFTTATLSAAAGVALLLGLVGIYGVISYVVSQRTREIGVRMALGASPPTVRSMVVRQSMVLVVLGVGIGLVAAGALSSVMASILFGVSGTDPVTYGSVAIALTVVALAASWIPARRAAGVDPSNALRAE